MPINTTTVSQSRLLADCTMVMVAIIWGVNIVVMKVAIGEMNMHLFNSLRLTLSAVTLGLCSWYQYKTSSPQQQARSTLTKFQTFGIISGFSILTGGIYQLAFVIGINWTTASNTALIMSSVPMWTAILSAVLVREMLVRIAWAGLLITFSGTAIVTLQNGGSDMASARLAGNLVILFAAIAWALAAVISRPMLRFISPIRLAFLATTSTLPVHFLAAFFESDHHFSQQTFDWSMIGCIFYSGIFSTGLAYAMWNYGVQQLGASHASIFQNLVPLIALICSWYFLGDRITLAQYFGGALIIAGLLVIRRNREPKRK